MFEDNVYFCPYCNVKTNNNICCELCTNDLKNFVNTNVGKTEYCDSFTAPFLYDDIIREAMLNFKFNNKKNYCESFCYFMKECDICYCDIVVCVPSFRNKNRYNTADLLAKRMAKFLNVKYERRAIKKVKETKLQHECDFKNRLLNLNDSFIANEKLISGKDILICDDIITSGSTIDEVAKACKKAGAKNVYAVAFAVSNGSFRNFDDIVEKFEIKF